MEHDWIFFPKSVNGGLEMKVSVNMRGFFMNMTIM